MKKTNFKSNKKTNIAKRFLGYMIISALLVFMIIASAIIANAEDTVFSNEKAKIDFTDSNAKGTVKINGICNWLSFAETITALRPFSFASLSLNSFAYIQNF